VTLPPAICHITPSLEGVTSYPYLRSRLLSLHIVQIVQKLHAAPVRGLLCNSFKVFPLARAFACVSPARERQMRFSC